ncbi:MAG: phenylacetate--CoA ligase [Candidatus Rokubacteria bacterium]|nr:phenylacetate--CoA ligase [Candidatus Rokubacteria bacterium]
MADIPYVERLSREELETLQLARLRRVVGWVYERVPFYRERLKAAGIRPENLRSPADIQRLPFTAKVDLRDHYPFGLLAVPQREVVRIHASSGTTGKPIVVAYTRSDLEVWAEVMARTLETGNVGPGDVVHNGYGYGLFTGGLGFHYGAERLGATVIPLSGGFTERQLMAMRDFGSTVLCCTPSYSLHLAEALAEAGVKPGELKLRVGFFGAEPWTEAMRDQIESRLGLAALNIYGLSEVIGPGVAVECLEKNGMHVHEDHFLTEVIDPETLAPVPPGMPGELVFTTLTKEALPLLRYRTRDLSLVLAEPCPCGRTLRRIARITGRTDDMLIIRGVNVFPSQVEHVLMQTPGAEPHYLLVLRRERALDTLEVQVEARAEVQAAGPTAVGALAAQIRRRLHEALGLTVEVTALAPKTLERSVGKAQRVRDLRQRREKYSPPAKGGGEE